MSESKNDERLLSILQKLKQKYPPSASEAESSLQLKTSEIIRSLLDLDPLLMIDDKDLFLMLESEGYNYEAIEEDEKLEFRWLMG